MNPDQSSKFSKKLSGSWLINNLHQIQYFLCSMHSHCLHYVHYFQIFRTTALEFQDFPGFSRTYAFFQDFPGLEISTIKFQDFPGSVRTLYFGIYEHHLVQWSSHSLAVVLTANFSYSGKLNYNT